MNRTLVLGLALVLFIAGCGGTATSEPETSDAGAADAARGPLPSDSWPESIETTAPWPTFGSAVDGVVTAPTWVPPQTLACEDSVRVKREPLRDFQPGDGPRTIVLETLGTKCKPAGSRATLVDDPSYPAATLLFGTCETGIVLRALDRALATVTFASATDCSTFMSLRNDSASGKAKRRLETTLVLETPAPSPTFRFVSAREASDEAAFVMADAK